jgi:glc operon protein GlcG
MAKLRVADCRRFFDAVTEKADEMHVPVSMAVVNAEGHLIALERMDDAGFITAEIAWGKAFTVAAFRSMSPRFPDGLVIQQWFKERNPQMLMNASIFTGGRVVVSGGCAPVFAGDEMVGAYGISGGTSDQDEVMGRYAREKIGWAHLKEHDDTPEDVKAHINEIYGRVGLSDRQL